ncbi:unnamed protein product [Litomosoides sigmodontis]|uniref:Uncharacterized protein n=1 Tax=Litomosoides sigmodontis TaxID=42156 RepID=A0A3P6TUV7_LITSI|nr:unnamed protein product [Litomosoides sigmodontis]
MDPVHLSMPDLSIAARRRLFRSTIHSVHNVTNTDTAWDLHGLRRTGWGEKLLRRRSESASDYLLSRYRTAPDTATGSPVKDIIDAYAKNGVDHHINTNNGHFINNNVDDTLANRKIIQQHRSLLENRRGSKKNDVIINSVSHPAVHHEDTHNKSDSDTNNDVENRNGRGNNSNSDYGKLSDQFLQRYHYSYLNDYKKFHFVTVTGRNWFWKNIAVKNSNAVSARRYSLLNKPFQQTSSAASNNNNSSMRNIIKMAKHIAECLEQFNTGLDKVLQARQLLETSQELPTDDRETMLRLLNQAMRTSLKRMEYNDDRYEPDGRHSESPNSLGGQRQCAPAQELYSTNSSFHNTSSMDPTEFFQQHGQQLLALLQQNMAKQN